MATPLDGKECRAAKSCIVLELQDVLTTPNGLDQSHGFSKTLASLAPDVQIIQRPSEWTADMAADAAQNVLTQNPDLAGIFRASELMATAIDVQLKAAGKHTAVGDPASIIRVPIHGRPQGLQQIRENALDATVSQPLSAYATKTAEMIALVSGGGTIELGPHDDGQVIETAVGPQYRLKAALVMLKNVDSPDLWQTNWPGKAMATVERKNVNRSRPIVEKTNIIKTFGSKRTLRGVDFTVMPDEIHAILARNGAGQKHACLGDLRLYPGGSRPDPHCRHATDSERPKPCRR